MIVLLHISTALASIVYTTYLYFRPSKHKFYVTYGLIAATLASGIYLVISTHSPLLSSCITGIVYLTVILASLFAAVRKLSV